MIYYNICFYEPVLVSGARRLLHHHVTINWFALFMQSLQLLHTTATRINMHSKLIKFFTSKVTIHRFTAAHQQILLCHDSAIMPMAPGLPFRNINTKLKYNMFSNLHTWCHPFTCEKHGRVSAAPKICISNAVKPQVHLLLIRNCERQTVE